MQRQRPRPWALRGSELADLEKDPRPDCHKGKEVTSALLAVVVGRRLGLGIIARASGLVRPSDLERASSALLRQYSAVRRGVDHFALPARDSDPHSACNGIPTRSRPGNHRLARAAGMLHGAREPRLRQHEVIMRATAKCNLGDVSPPLPTSPGLGIARDVSRRIG
jgi:hypothetical protein